VVAGGYPEDGTVSDPVAGSAASITTIAAGEATYWTDLEKHGIAVVAMRETPVPDYSLADCVLKYGRTSAKCMVPTARAISADSPNVLAARDTGGKVPLIDLNQFICGPQECAPVVGNILVYFDGRHLTSSYSKSMVPYLEPRLLTAAPVLAK
jgi:SGNH domain (fused to AT3 domains)